jgi:dihydropteroate synthase
MEAKDTFFSKKTTIRCGGKFLDLSSPCVMGILNITPDSFYEGSRARVEREILNRAEHILSEGAKIIDIGAESTRPGATAVSEDEELERLIPAVELIRKEFPDCIISADTYKSSVAKASVEAGANIINDVSGGAFDDDMFETVAGLKVPYILMHTKGTPQTMVKQANYEDVLKEIMLYFSQKVFELKNKGVADIILDPGFGFAKNLSHNYELLSRLEEFIIFDLPLLIGVSRKKMISGLLNINAEEALNGTTVVNTMALMKGASILRVHDVKQAVEAVKIITFAQNPTNAA